MGIFDDDDDDFLVEASGVAPSSIEEEVMDEDDEDIAAPKLKPLPIIDGNKLGQGNTNICFMLLHHLFLFEEFKLKLFILFFR